MHKAMEFRIASRPAADVELALRVKNEEATLTTRLLQAVVLLETQAVTSAVVVVDCGSVDHSVDVALSVASRVPIHTVSCSETVVGWMAAAAFTSSAATIAFASSTERVHLLAQTRFLVDERAPVVATTKEVPGFRRLSQRPVNWSARQRDSHRAARIDLVHMDIRTATRLFSANAGVSTLEGAIDNAIAQAVIVRELRSYEPVGLRSGKPLTSLRPRATVEAG